MFVSVEGGYTPSHHSPHPRNHSKVTHHSQASHVYSKTSHHSSSHHTSSHHQDSVYISKEARLFASQNTSHYKSPHHEPSHHKTVTHHSASKNTKSHSNNRNTLFNQGVSFVYDILPGVGTAKSYEEYLSGKDFITGEKVPKTEALMGMIPEFKGISKASKEISKGIDEAYKEYKLSRKASHLNLSKAKNKYKTGASSHLAPGGGLRAHEAKGGAKGGHLIDRHVGKTKAQLLERFSQKPKLPYVSTFKNRATAEKVAKTVLTIPKNKKLIDKWLHDPSSRSTLTLKYHGKETIGKGIAKGAKKMDHLNNAVIVLKKSKKGNFILTGYPTR